MKNNKIIFLVATVCCLVVCWLCFGAWTIADTSYQVSDFNYDTATAYLYVVPSSNIPSSEYSNLLIYGQWIRTYSSTMKPLTNGTFSSMTRTDSGFRYASSSAHADGSAVKFYVNVSSLDTSIGSYIITGSYYITSSLAFSTTWSQSNYANKEFSASDYRTMIVFVDKLPTVSGGVSQEEYDDVVDQLEQQQLINDQLSNDNLTLQEDLNALQVNYNQVSQQLAQAEQNYTNLQTEFSNLQTSYNQVVNDRDAWERYAHGIEEQLDELTESNARLQRDYDNLLREYNIIISENESIGFVERAFLAVGNILEIEILPNITIGTIVAVPLILGVVFLVLRLVRGE